MSETFQGTFVTMTMKCFGLVLKIFIDPVLILKKHLLKTRLKPLAETKQQYGVQETCSNCLEYASRHDHAHKGERFWD